MPDGSAARVDPVPVEVAVRGDVDPDAAGYARSRLQAVIDQTGGAVLFARAKLTMAPDPARDRPALAQMTLDLNGHLVRAQVAAHGMHEAVDLAQRRLRDQLAHRATRSRDLHRSSGIAGPGEWQHRDLPAQRPDFYERPPEERHLIRRKTVAVSELTPDEAAFDMDQMDFDFHLFRDSASGTLAVIERMPGGSFRLTRLRPGGTPEPPTAVELTVSDRPPPTTTLSGAIRLLEGEGTRFVFFADSATGRGNVIYRRYDGHYGLITPD